MKPRTSALATLVASVLVLLVTAGVWLGSEARGVGTDLPLADYGPTQPASATSEGSEPAGADDSAKPANQDKQEGRGDKADPPSPLPSPGSIKLRDATRIGSADQEDPPRRLRIRSVDVSMPIVATGVRDNGLMKLPDDPGEIGWYRFGPSPGSRRGSVVLGGHVDSTRVGVGPLAKLAAVRKGDAITVTDAEGAPVRYRVSSVERIRKAALPTDRLFDPQSAPRLVLITCGGRYLPDRGGYEDNIVVIARPA